MYHTRYSYPFYIKDVRRVGQLRADKVVQNVRKIHRVLRFSKTGRLRCTGVTRRAQIIKVAKQLGQLRAAEVV